MNVRFELTIGWLSIVFEPSTYVDADEPEDTEPEPAKGSAQPLDSSSWLGDSSHPPELQVGHRDPWYDRQPCGFRPRNTPPR